MKNSDFFNMLNNKYGINLNKQQRTAAVHDKGPCLLLAVPGAGKTTTMLCRTAYLILNSVKPDNILSITFSRASAKDMEEKFKKMFEQGLDASPEFSTIHIFAYKVVLRYYHKSKIKLNIIENDKDRGKLKVIKDAYSNYNDGEKINDDDLDNIINRISFVKNMMLEDDEIDNYPFPDENTIPCFKSIYLDYEKYKRETGLIDFDDMLTECHKAFINDSTLLEELRNKYKYIQVDEGQDTSKIQHEIIKILASAENNILYICDDDQSIYGFRAAYPEFLLKIRETYPDAKILFMEENFRSSKNIVAVCSSFIKINKKRYDKNMVTSNAEGNKVKIITLDDTVSQYIILTESLKDLNEREAAVLYRNKRSSILVADYFIKNNIEFTMTGYDRSFFNHWIVNDMLSFMKFASNQKDIVTFGMIYRKLQGFYITNAMYDTIKYNKSDNTVFEKLSKIKGLQEYQVEKIKELRCKTRRLSGLNPHEAIAFIESELNYNKQMEFNKSRYGYSVENQKNILFILKMLSAEIKDYKELKEKLEILEKQLKEAEDNKTCKIVLSTIHSSKGLEWDDVYMIDLINGEFPANKSDTEEERRLFYVGMTRAKQNLTIFKCNNRFEETVVPSIFINEAEKQGANHISKSSKTFKKPQNAKTTTLKEKDIQDRNVPVDFDFEDLFKNESSVKKYIDKDAVQLGSKVKLRDMEYDEILDYTIVVSSEADPMKDKISNISPLGSALLGKKKGTEIEVSTPSGKTKYEILEVD